MADVRKLIAFDLQANFKKIDFSGAKVEGFKMPPMPTIHAPAGMGMNVGRGLLAKNLSEVGAMLAGGAGISRNIHMPALETGFTTVGAQRGRPSLDMPIALPAVGDVSAARTPDLIKETSELRENMGTLADAFKETNESKKKLDKNLEKLKKEEKETGKETKSLTDKIVEMGGKLRSTSRLFFYASLDMMQFANVIIGPLRQGLEVFRDYNRSLAQLRVTYEFLSSSGQEAVAQLSQTFEELADSTEFSRREIAKAAVVFGTANIAVEDVAASMEDLTSLARINFTTMDQMAAITLRTVRRFSISLEEAREEMWRLTAISQQTGESIQQVANQLGYASELGQELGFTFSEIVTHMTLLTEVYGSASIAGRRLSSVYGNLIDKGEEYGIQLRDLNGEMLESRDQIANLADYLDLIADPIEQNQYLMELFGKSGASSARAIVDAWKEGRYDKMMEDSGDQTIDTLKGISDTLKDDLYVQLQALNSSMEDFSSRLSEAVVPALEKLLPMLTDVIDRTGRWMRENKELITMLGGAAIGVTALGGAVKGTGFMIEIIVALATATKGLKLAMAKLGGQAAATAVTVSGEVAPATGLLSRLMSALTGTLGTVALALGAVVVIGKGFMDSFKKMIDDSARLKQIIDQLHHSIDILIKYFQALVGFITTAVVGTLWGVVYIFESIGSAIAGVVAALLDWDNALRHLQSAIDDIQQGFENLGKGIWEILQSLMPHSPSLADRVLELGDAFAYSLGPMKEFRTVGRGLRTDVGNVRSKFVMTQANATAAAMQGYGQGEGDTHINIDGAYIQDPEELVEVILSRQIRKSSRYYRSTSY